jgi:hypothetical protein
MFVGGEYDSEHSISAFVGKIDIFRKLLFKVTAADATESGAECTSLSMWDSLSRSF